MVKVRHLRLKVRRLILWLILLRGSPEAIGLGIAIGIFTGFSPFIGFQMLLATFFATILSANRPAAMVAVWITNPFTFVPIYLFTYRVGKYFLPGPQEGDAYQIINKIVNKLFAMDFWEIYNQFLVMKTFGRKIFFQLLIGGVIAGLIAGGVSYFLTIRIVRTYRKLKLKE